MRQQSTHGIGWTLVVAIALTLGGCQAAHERPSDPAATNRAAPEGGFGAVPGAAPAPLSENKLKAPDTAQGRPQGTEARHIIRRAEVTLLVSAVPRAVEAVRSLVKDKGGYVSDESLQTASGEVPSGTVTLRVPVVRFDEVLQAFGSLGEMQARRISAEDVTLEVVDTESRLRNLRREEEQFLKVLSRSGSIRDVLAVERELARVRGDIEQTTGRLRQLNNLVDLATITVTLTARAEQAVTSPWDLAPVVRNAWQDAQAQLAVTTARALSGLVWLGAYVIPLAVPSLLIYLAIGWILARLMVGRVAWLTPDRFRMVWGALGAALLVLVQPSLLLLILALAALVFAASKVPAIRHRWQPKSPDRP
ncbi:MAG TPA: DUF4349 domain-containing protein [Stenomitos sp.]